MAREICGIIGSLRNTSQIQKKWNAYFKEKGIDAFMSKYPASKETLPERLSEMFHFGRRMYFVGGDLQSSINEYLDELDDSSFLEGKSNLIINKFGTLRGYYVPNVWLEPEVFLSEHKMAIVFA